MRAHGIMKDSDTFLARLGEQAGVGRFAEDL